MQSFIQLLPRSGHGIVLAGLMTFGNVAGVLPEASAQTTEVRKTNPVRLEEPALEQLPPALLKRVPVSVADLQQIEDHVQALVQNITACTVALQVGPAQGSGVLVSAEGHVLTAAHVSGPPGRRIVITLPDGTQMFGQTLGRNRTLDASLVKIDATDRTWPYVKMADIDEVQQGDWCLVTGHPGGYQSGRPPVIRLGRVIAVTDRDIRTDCELVGGDSGGPLFDMRGQVIGINSRIGEDTSVNLHVPVNVYTDDWDRLLAAESFRVHSGAFLGVQGEPVDGGVKLTKVWSEQPAARAGIQEGDVLLKFQRFEVRTMEQLKKLVGEEPPGRRVRITLQRENKILEMTVRLGSR